MIINTVLIIGCLIAMFIFSAVKITRDKRIKDLARIGRGIYEGLKAEGYTKKAAWYEVQPEYKKAMNECKRLRIKY